MPTTFYRQARTRASVLAAVLFAVFAAVLFLAPPAQAHDELISSNPADGAVLEAAPSEIELVFSSELMDLGNQVIVEDAAGNNLAESEPVLTRETLAQALPELDAGDYQVNWRAVSSDGHPITGTFSFTVSGPAAESPSPAATESAAAPAASEPAATAAPEAVSESTSFGPMGWILTVAGIALVAVLVYVVVTQARKRRGTGA